MPAPTFDGNNLEIILPSTGTYDAKIDLYSDWKEWQLEATNMGYPPAFDTTGGDDIGSGQSVSAYYFIRNDLGWRIKMPEEDGTVVIEGNLFPRDATKNFIRQPTGDFTVLVQQQVSSRAISLVQSEILDMLKIIRGDEDKTDTRYQIKDEDTGEVLLDKDVQISGDDITITKHV